MTEKLRDSRSLFGGRAVLAMILQRLQAAEDDGPYRLFRDAVEAGDTERAAQLAALFWGGRR
ncbi:hypothetical protein [Azospirillum rugosum]|uniref:Glyoxalase superfamily protein PhnB n=1 Tax=Azospirillum rugosum TaxID=416170 RepID=A0ABS4SL74_9PROT|nr:hypothetical protein [Azospirillum rugosum]MBP2292838.1 putative glyoxalase superfamily protein PhnB [Azospirillum rugosum]MDQ0529410.1 putative glyoxalase superfamily protein PhnB [Azospirillum rugosum]